MANQPSNTTTESNVLTSKTLYKANGRGEDASKESFKCNCFPKGNGQTFVDNAVKGLGVGFVERAITQTLSIDARAAFVKKENMARWQPNADGTASSGDGYATIRRDLRKKGLPADVIEAIVENAKSNAVEV